MDSKSNSKSNSKSKYLKYKNKYLQLKNLLTIKTHNDKLTSNKIDKPDQNNIYRQQINVESKEQKK